MSAAVDLRPAAAGDSRACFDVFRRSLGDLMHRTGHPEAGALPGADALWPAYEGLFAHLAATCAQWWIAEDGDGRLAGYARSTLRGDVLELTEFFVAPESRVRGVGRALLEHAFGPGLGTHRAVIATVDAPAVALYLRFGVRHQASGADFSARPRRVAAPAGLEAEPATLDELLALEQQLLGHGRREDLAFMLRDRPAVVLRRGGRPAGYAFLANTHGYAGPIGALDPADLPGALAYVEDAAAAAGIERLDLTVPLAAHAAVDWLLGERGFRIDPFYCLFLADGPWARLDRYLPFNPCLML
ncbi:MAG TPA: GNAT family N-acetyltransferase [Solirubrobacteraceae bacterium]|nr:GNAT family N-acetyltransferase [Solirubrobacteraceae bacterium]